MTIPLYSIQEYAPYIHLVIIGDVDDYGVAIERIPVRRRSAQPASRSGMSTVLSGSEAWRVYDEMDAGEHDRISLRQQLGAPLQKVATPPGDCRLVVFGRARQRRVAALADPI